LSTEVSAPVLADSSATASPDGQAAEAGPRWRRSVNNRIRRSWSGYALALPLVVFVGSFFLYPILRLAWTSFVISDAAGGLSFTTAPFARVFADPYARGTVIRTFRVALVSTLLTLLIAYPLTLWMRQISAKWRGIVTTLLLSPLLTSVVVRTLGWTAILTPSGALDQLFELVGLKGPSLLYTEAAIVIGLTQDFIGFMVLSLMTSVLRIPDSVIRAAFNLGARPLDVIRRIVLPLSVPGMLAGVSIVFPLTAGSYVIPALLGGSRNSTLGTETYNQAIILTDFPRAAAIALVLFFMITVVTVILTLVTRKVRKVIGS